MDLLAELVDAYAVAYHIIKDYREGKSANARADAWLKRYEERRAGRGKKKAELNS